MSNPFTSFQQSCTGNCHSTSNASSHKTASMLVGALIVGIACLFFTGCNRLSKTITYKENETQDELLKKAQKGDAEAMYKYASRCKKKKDGIKWMKKSAEKGYARAQFDLGIAYTEGGVEGIDLDSDKSKEWLTKSSKQGFPLAKVYCLYKGIGCEPDKDKAWQELDKSANAGWVESQVLIAAVYAGSKEPFDFKEIDKSEDKAKYWLEKAAENGFEIAQMAMGSFYVHKREFKDALKWYKKAAVQGNPDAQCILASAYYEGEDIEKNMAEAKKWAQKAVDQGYEDAKRILDKINKESKSSSDSDSSDSDSSDKTSSPKSSSNNSYQNSSHTNDSFDDLDDDDDFDPSKQGPSYGF